MKDVAGLKAALLKKEPHMIRHLTEKLRIYASGCMLEPAIEAKSIGLSQT